MISLNIFSLSAPPIVCCTLALRLPDASPGEYHWYRAVIAGRETNTLAVRRPQILKNVLLSAITSDMGLRLLSPLGSRCVTFLFMHRFQVPDLGVRGHDPKALARQLEYLRRRRYRFLSVSQLLERLDDGSPLETNAVIFTVDDGYADFAAVAAPVFAAYDCPVTVFLITDFTSGRLWTWFDRVDWAFANSERRQVSIDVGADTVRYEWTNPTERERVTEAFVERLKKVPDATREKLIADLNQLFDVEVPERAPEKYRAMTWEQVRACARNGVTFGPHTVTHPILSRVDPTRADYEIGESWRAVVKGTDAAVPVFCYPNGTASDFSARDKAIVARAGMTAGLSTIGGSLESSASGLKTPDLFALPRYAYSEDQPEFVQIVSGLEDRKRRLRALLR